MAKRKKTKRRRRRGSFGFLYKLLSMLVICGAIVTALTLFFQVGTVEVSGQKRYTEKEIQDASGVQTGDNLILLNKYSVQALIRERLPYVEEIRINRRLPATLLVEVQECGTPLAVIQDGSAWLVSPNGASRVVDRVEVSKAQEYGVISGCRLLAPSVGGQLALDTEYLSQQESLLALLGALQDAGMMDRVDGIRLDDLDAIRMGFDGRFTVKMPYGADYPMKLKILRLALESGKVQDNMHGTFDMMREDGRTYLDQSVR